MQLLHSPYIVIPPFLCNNSLNNKSIRLKSLVLTFWTAMEETTMEIRIAPKYEFQYPLNLHCSQTSNLKFQLLIYLRINPARLLHKSISLIITHFHLLFQSKFTIILINYQSLFTFFKRKLFIVN